MNTRTGLLKRVVGGLRGDVNHANGLQFSRLNDTRSIVMDGTTSLYIGDQNNFKIKVIALAMNAITTWAGTGQRAQSAMNNVIAPDMQFSETTQMQVFRGGLYVPERSLPALYRGAFLTKVFTIVCTPTQKTVGLAMWRGVAYLTMGNQVKTCQPLHEAGSDPSFFINNQGNPGDRIGDDAATVKLQTPFKLSVDCLRHMLIISDSGNNKIKAYGFKTKITSVLFGSGAVGAPTTSNVAATSISFGFLAETLTQNRTLWIADNASGVLVVGGLTTPPSYHCVETNTRSQTFTESETPTVSDSDSLTRQSRTETIVGEPETVTQTLSDTDDYTKTATNSDTAAISAIDGTTNDPTQTLDPSFTKSESWSVTESQTYTESLTMEHEHSVTSQTSTDSMSLFPAMNMSAVGGTVVKIGTHSLIARFQAEAGLIREGKAHFSVELGCCHFNWDVSAPERLVGVTSNKTVTDGYFTAFAAHGKKFLKISVERSKQEPTLMISIGPVSDISYLPREMESITFTFNERVIEPRPPMSFSILIDIRPLERNDTLGALRPVVNGILGIATAVNPSGLTVSMLAQASRTASLTTARDCPNDDEISIDGLSHPLQIVITSEFNVRQHLGAVVCDSCIYLALIALHFILACIVQYVDHNCYHHVHPISHYERWVHFPTYSIQFLFFFVQPIFTGGVFVAAHSAEFGIRALGAGAAAVSLGGALLLATLTVYPRFQAMYLLPKDYDKNADAVMTCESFTVSKGTWVDTLPGLDFCRNYGAMFDECRQGLHWFILLDLVITVALSIVDAHWPKTRSQCIGKAAATMTVFIINFLLVIVLRPYNTWFNKIVLTSVAFLQALTSILAFTEFNGGDSTESARTACVFVVILLLMMKGLVDARYQIEYLYNIAEKHRMHLRAGFLIQQDRNPVAATYVDVPYYKPIEMIEKPLLLENGTVPFRLRPLPGHEHDRVTSNIDFLPRMNPVNMQWNRLQQAVMSPPPMHVHPFGTKSQSPGLYSQYL